MARKLSEYRDTIRIRPSDLIVTITARRSACDVQWVVTSVEEMSLVDSQFGACDGVKSDDIGILPYYGLSVPSKAESGSGFRLLNLRAYESA